MVVSSEQRAPRRRWIFALVALVGLAGLGWLGASLHSRLLAAALLLRMEGDKAAPDFLVHYGERAIDERPLALPSGTRAILYTPRGAEQAAALVLVHGIHAQGIEEPRIVALARAIASSGLVVLTPELTDLAHYRVTHGGAETIAEAARTLAKRQGRARVAVFGISFGGGLALRAACEPALRGAIDRVIALGAHHDAGVVSRFFLGEPARGPTGERAALSPHGYGAVVLFESLFQERHKGPINETEKARLRRALGGRTRELADASPAHCPESPRVPLHLVHGLGDRIVPYTETLWNARQFGPHTRLSVLISPAIVHAEYTQPGLWERIEMVNFMAEAIPSQAGFAVGAALNPQ